MSVLDALLSEDFKPDEPRDPLGKWMKVGAVVAESGRGIAVVTDATPHPKTGHVRIASMVSTPRGASRTERLVPPGSLSPYSGSLEGNGSTRNLPDVPGTSVRVDAPGSLFHGKTGTSAGPKRSAGRTHIRVKIAGEKEHSTFPPNSLRPSSSSSVSISRHGKTYPGTIVRETPTRRLVRYTTGNGKTKEVWEPRPK